MSSWTGFLFHTRFILNWFLLNFFPSNFCTTNELCQWRIHPESASLLLENLSLFFSTLHGPPMHHPQFEPIWTCLRSVSFPAHLHPHVTQDYSTFTQNTSWGYFLACSPLVPTYFCLSRTLRSMNTSAFLQSRDPFCHQCQSAVTFPCVMQPL